MALFRLGPRRGRRGQGHVPITLELLTKARALGVTVEAFYGGDADGRRRRPLGEYGATKVYDAGDIGGSLPGVPSAVGAGRADQGGNSPTLILFPPPTTAATSPAACRPSSTARCSPTSIGIEVDGDDRRQPRRSSAGRRSSRPSSPVTSRDFS